MSKRSKPSHAILKDLPQEFQQLADSAIDHVGKVIDRIDPLETAAIAALAYMIKNTMDWTQTNLDWFTARGQIDIPIITPLADILIRKPVQVYKDLPDQIEWVMSFLAAYFIVRHFNVFLASGKTITQFALFLLTR